MFWVSVSFCFANSFAFSSLRNVSVDREKARFAGLVLFCSNETYQVSWGLTAMGVLAGNETASSFRWPAATRHRVARTSSAAAVTARANWPLPPPSRRRRAATPSGSKPRHSAAVIDPAPASGVPNVCPSAKGTKVNGLLKVKVGERVFNVGIDMGRAQAVPWRLLLLAAAH